MMSLFHNLTSFEIAMIAGVGSLFAGLIGSLTGLGGGVVIVPLLTLALDVDLRYAIGASIVSVIATSSGAAAAYVREGYTNLRIGMFLELATASSALAAASLAAYVPTRAIAIVFGVVLVGSAALDLAARSESPRTDWKPDAIAKRLRLNSSFPVPEGQRAYEVHRVPAGFALMMLAGALSGLLGIGSGALKVVAMDRAMAIPFKVSTTTSNFMIGVTAAAGAGVYFHRGYVDPGLAFPVVLGVTAGAFVGARVLPRTQSRSLRLLFGLVILALAAQMIYQGITGSI